MLTVYIPIDKHLASKIVNQYVDAIEKDAAAFKKISSLMYSKKEIEEAFFVFMEEYIKLFRCLGEDFGIELVSWYSMMDLFIADSEAERLNECLERGLAVIDKNDQIVLEPTLLRMMRLSKGIHDGVFSNHPNTDKMRHALIKYATDSRNGVYFDEINEHFGRCSEKYIPKAYLSLSHDQILEEAVKRVRSEFANNDNEWWKIRQYRAVDNSENKEADAIPNKSVTGVAARKVILKYAAE